MPSTPKTKSTNRRLTDWINQGLKRSNWSARRIAQVGLLIAIGVIVAGLYLMQSSQIVTSTRQVQLLRDELAQLQQENADLAVKTSEATTRAQMEQRAKALGFAPTDNLIFVPVPHTPVDDSPSVESIYAPSR